MNKFEEAEIIAKELNKQNDWYEISKRKDLTVEQLKLFKDKLLWPLILVRYENLPNDLLDQVISEGNVEDDSSFWRYLAKQAKDKEFIKKYKDHLDLRDIARNNNFKTRELIEMFGKPEVGTGATEIIGSDSRPFTIIEVSNSGLKIKLQADKYTHTSDFDYYSNQSYTYEPDTNGIIIEATLRKDGQWKSSGMPIAIGHRRRYENPSF